MIADPISFLVSLARYAAARDAAQASPAGLALGTSLFVTTTGNAAVDAYVVLRAFGGGNDRTTPGSTVNVQISAGSKNNNAAWRLAQAAFEMIALDDIGREARMVHVPAFDANGEAVDPPGEWMLVSAVTIGRPGQVGRDNSGWVTITANVALGFYRNN